MTSYDGGKGGAGVAQWIINQIPPHRLFISAFLGNCAVMRAKRPAERNIGIELDQAVIAAHWADVPTADIRTDTRRWVSEIGVDRSSIGGSRDPIVICGDALTTLARLATGGDTFLYCDPPYLLSTRSQQRPLYAHEFATIEQHRALLTLLRKLPCMVAISGYWSALYELELAGWRASQFWTADRAGNRKEEWLWMNYGEPIELHDYRYLGSNFRERERIKRKKARWTNRLARMDSLERLCLMEAIGELRASIAGSGDAPAPDPIVGSGEDADRDPIAGNGDSAGDQGASSEMAMGMGVSLELAMSTSILEALQRGCP